MIAIASLLAIGCVPSQSERQPVSQAPTFSRLPTNTKPPQLSAATQKPTAKQLFQIMETTIGKSVEGRDIKMLRLGTAAPVMLIMAGIHGDEVNSCTLIDRFIALQKSESLTHAGSIVFIPRANPDGFFKRVRRNAHGVDLNRNFPSANWAEGPKGQFYGGPSPLSEPESHAIHRIIEELKPSMIVSIHSIWAGGQCNNYDGPGKAIAEAMNMKNHFPVKASIGYPTPGSLGNWAGNDKKIPIITLEMPPKVTDDKMWIENCDALRAAISAR